jgi:hypothetical protein
MLTATSRVTVLGGDIPYLIVNYNYLSSGQWKMKTKKQYAQNRSYCKEVVLHKAFHTLRPCLIYCVSHLSCNRFWFIHQSPLAVTNRHPLAKQEELGENMAEFCLRDIPFHTRRNLWHDVKSYDMGPTALLPLRRKSCHGFLLPLKIHRPRPNMNPWNLGPVASTGPPRATNRS